MKIFIREIVRKVIFFIYDVVKSHTVGRAAESMQPSVFEALRISFSKALAILVPAPQELIDEHAVFLLDDLIRDSATDKGAHDWFRMFEFVNKAFSLGVQPDPRPQSLSGGSARPTILFVSGMYPSVEHAGGLRIHDLIRELSRDYDIDLFSVYRNEIDGRSKGQLDGLLTNEKCVSSEEFRATQAAKWITEVRGSGFRYDIIHFEYNQSIELIGSLRVYSRKSIFTYMECESLRRGVDIESALRDNKPIAPSFVLELFKNIELELHAMRIADSCVYVSEPDSNYLSRFGGGPSLIVPTGVSETELLTPLREYSAGKSDGPKRMKDVLFLAYFGSKTNIDSAAWYIRYVHPLVLAAEPDYKFFLVGKGDTFPLRGLWPDDGSVIFAGSVDCVAIPIVEATICVSPVVSSSGFRGKINQYSAARKATVATSLSAKGLEYEPGVSILIADAPGEFAGAILSLLRDKNLRRRIGDRAYEVVDRYYKWSAIVNKLTAFYKRDTPALLETD